MAIGDHPEKCVGKPQWQPIYGNTGSVITDPLTAIAALTTTAIVCQWVGARLNLPSVLFLLAAGVALSPIVDPDAIFGDLLFVGIGLGVAILLFEGGTGLNWSKISTGRTTVIRLVTVGALVGWGFASVAASIFLDIDNSLAALIGAILIVSGPTVIMPLLRVVRPREPAGSILQWEGILIDPVGAGLAIVVLDAIISDRSWSRSLIRIFTTFGAGLAVGGAIAGIVLFALRQHAIADHLHVPVTLAAVIASYALANEIRPEAGLVAVTLLGMAFANQKSVPTGHITEFNEHLGASVLGILFVVLGARVEVDDVIEYLPASLAITAVLVLVARPLTVLASTVGTQVVGRDRKFIMSLAPRGVVAAAVASLFALELEHHDIDPGPLVPVVFTVVVLTVALAGTTARYWAHRHRVARPTPNGVAIIGGGAFGFALADALGELLVATLHVGLSDAEAMVAAERGQLSYMGRLDTSDFDATVSGVGIASAVAISGTDHLDAYATQRLAHSVGSANVFGVVPASATAPALDHGAPPRRFLPDHITDKRLHDLGDRGAKLRVLPTAQANEDGWITVCVVDADRNVAFARDLGSAGPNDMIVQLDASDIEIPQ